MKSQTRVLGIDDAPFRFGDATTDVVGVLLRGKEYVEAVLRTNVEVDGTDATEKLEAMLLGSRYREQVSAVMVDGIALGGFNVVNLARLHDVLGVPVMSVTRDRPDLAGIEAALRKHFDDWERRLVLMQVPLHKVETDHNPVYVGVHGMPPRDAGALVRATTVRGVIPEPIRVAHLVATAYKTGESYGRP
ncbi:MAG: endonuclease dU [Methanobacteriota archaeon]